MGLGRVAVVGAGSVGQAVARLLASSSSGESENAVRVVLGARRPEAAAATLAKAEPALFDAGSIAVAETPVDAAAQADLVLLTVPDGAISQVCSDLVREGAFHSKPTVAHCSGALTSHAALGAAASAGCLIASAHPLLTFPDADAGVRRLPGAYWFCEVPKRWQL